MLKYLRIAVTALSLMACVLLVALWVRTAFAHEIVTGPVGNSHSLVIGSLEGAVGVRLFEGGSSEWMRLSLDPGLDVPLPFSTFAGFGGIARYQSNVFWLRVPYWFLILVNGVVLAIQVRGWRMSFSLRTLLIAMTLVAVGLGIVVMVH